MSAHSPTPRDRGAVLPIVMVVSFVLGAVAVGVATYGTANLRYGRVTEDRSHQLAAADAAMSYAANLIEIRAADCIFSDQSINLPELAESFNGATGSVECTLTSAGLDSAALFALVLTGEGVPGADYLIETSGGSVKEISGPMFMERVDAAAFDLANNKGLLLDGAPLVHYDGTTPECASISENVLDSDVDFEPDAIFGPVCTGKHWDEYGATGTAFDEPAINYDFSPLWIDALAPANGGNSPVYDGGQAAPYALNVPLTSDPADSNKIVTVLGAYDDVPNAVTGNSCRVFEPGRYIRPPDTDGISVYFKSGDYLFDFRDPSGPGAGSFASWLSPGNLTQSEFQMNQTVATAGKADPDPDGDASTLDGFTQTVANPDCAPMIAADTGGYGATFYFSGSAHIALNTQAILEVMPRNKGSVADPLYVSMHAICDGAADPTWCVNSPSSLVPTNRFAPAVNPSNPALVWIKAGQVSEIVANGMIYAPRSELYFKNVANNAEVRLRGGAVLARATVDAAASADNLEIGVGSQDVDLDLSLIATGTDANGGSTRIVSDVELQYDEPVLDDRLNVLSWRVCETLSC